MALLKETQEEVKTKVFLNIKNGAIYHKTQVAEEVYKAVAGRLSDIYKRERVFRGEKVWYWYIDLEDNNTTYSLGFAYGSNLFKSIILNLATSGSYEDIKIEPYSSNGYDKVNVYEGGNKLSWGALKMPAVTTRAEGDRIIKDDSERMKFICSKVAEINSKIVK